MAVCEQVEDPNNAKGIVRRDVIRVITPGLVLDEENLKAGENHYLASIACRDGVFGLAFVDLSTGEFQAGEFQEREALIEALGGLEFQELLISSSFPGQLLKKILGEQLPPGVIRAVGEELFAPARARDFLERELEAGVLERSPVNSHAAAAVAAGAILGYVRDTQMTRAVHISEIKWYDPDLYLVIDETARRNLELFFTLGDGSRAGSLFSLINETITPMGTRLLRRQMAYPLLDVEKIRLRLAAVAEIKGNYTLREELRKALSGAYDLEPTGAIVEDVARTRAPFIVPTTGFGVFTGELPILYIPVVRTRVLDDLHAHLYRLLTGHFDPIEGADRRRVGVTLRHAWAETLAGRPSTPRRWPRYNPKGPISISWSFSRPNWRQKSCS